MNGFLFVPNTKNSSANGLFSIFNRHKGNSPLSLASGDTITATLTTRENGNATLRTDDDFTFTVPGDSVTGDVGDTLHFKVISQDSSGLALKQIFPQGLNVAMERGNAGIDDVYNVATSLEKMNEEAEYRAEAHKEKQVEAAQAVARIKRGQRTIANNATKSAIAAISASGLDLHKISFFTLSNMIKDIKALPDAPGSHANNINVDDAKDAISEVALEKVRDLLSGGLPDAAIAQLLKSGNDITPEQVYASRYLGGAETPAYFDNWDTLDKQIEKRFRRLEIESTPRNLEAARFLVANDLPISRNNVEATVLLRHLAHIPQEMLMAQVELSISHGEDPTQMKLMPLLSFIDMESVLDLVKDLPKLEGQDVRTVMEAGKSLNLKNLFEAADVRDTSSVGVTVDAPADIPKPTLAVPEENLITAQRQLAEIQWKMTVQAAVRLAHRGIVIDTVHLQELVMHLRALERENHAQYLRAAGTEDTKQNTARMEDIFRTIQEIRPVAFHLNANISGKVLTKKVDFNLQGVHQAAQAYESSATRPSGRYGDSFAKISDQFEGLLKNMGIEPTAENIRAASILSRNEIDVASSTIDAVKAIDAKIAAVMDRLSPMMAAQMLKDGYNPLDMHMDEMISYIRKFEDLHGYSGRDKIAQHILEMDKSQTLTPEERSGMIAIYRMLNLIHKNGSAALGVALKQDAPLTLGSLMEASKFYDGKKNVGGYAGDSFKHIANPPESIRATLSKAVSMNLTAPMSYADLLADDVIDKASPDTLKKWMPEEKVQAALEDLLQETPKPPAFVPNQDLASQAVKQFTDTPAPFIAMLQKAGVLPTPNNIKAARTIKEGSLTETLKEAISEFKANLFDFDMLQERLMQGEGQEEVIQNIWDSFGDALPTTAIRDAQMALAVHHALSNNGNSDSDIEIPIELNGRLASLKMYTLNESAVASGDARTFISLTTEGLGTVQSYFSIDGGKVNLRFAIDSQASRLKLENNYNMLAALLAEAGFEIGSLSFVYTQPTAETAIMAAQGKDVAIDPEEDLYTATLELSDYEFTV